MKSGSRRSRRHRNPPQEHQQNEPFFSAGTDTPVQTKKEPFFQPKLAIGQPGDAYEREADAVAEQVVGRQPGAPPAVQKQGVSTIQRLSTPDEEKMPGTNDGRMKEDKLIQEKAAPGREEEKPVQMQDKGAKPEEEKPLQMKPEEEEPVQAKPEEEEPVQMKEAKPEEEEPVQAKSEEEEPLQMDQKEEEKGGPAVQPKSESSGTGARSTAPPLSARLEQSKSGGKPLPRETKTAMEQAFGADFSGVQIHTGSDAEAMNQDLQAQAFTHGEDIYFNEGKFQPDDDPGKRLLAHELTHVLQQNGLRRKAVQRKENVNTKDEKELEESAKIIDRIKTNYGIDINSEAGVDAIKKDYSMVPKTVLDKLKSKDWEYKELVALEAALAHFAPILGKNRADSTRSGSDQEITSASKVDQAIDKNSAKGNLDTSTMGEYFEASKNFSMFTAGTESKQDFSDNSKQLEGTAVHEIAHGLMKYALADFVSKVEFWTDKNTKSGKKDAEAPITKYGAKSASEDLSEAVMYYFVERDTLKSGKDGKAKGEIGNPCPVRDGFIDNAVKNWSKKK